jgi:prephenate dehydrogenase
MKITKRQLRRIIKEEKQKILAESVTDMIHYEQMFEEITEQIASKFYNDMIRMAKDEPGMISTSIQEWEQQVVYAQQELDNKIPRALAEAIATIEDALHDGEYYTGDSGGPR